MQSKIVIYFILLFVSYKKSNFKSNNLDIKENKTSNAEEKKDNKETNIEQNFNKLSNNQETKSSESIPDDKSKTVGESIPNDKSKTAGESIPDDKSKTVGESIPDDKSKTVEESNNNTSNTPNTVKESCIYEVEVISLDAYHSINQFDQSLYTNSSGEGTAVNFTKFLEPGTYYYTFSADLWGGISEQIVGVRENKEQTTKTVQEMIKKGEKPNICKKFHYVSNTGYNGNGGWGGTD